MEDKAGNLLQISIFANLENASTECLGFLQRESNALPKRIRIQNMLVRIAYGYNIFL